MGSEVLLYGYGTVCVCMLVFNIIYNFSLKGKDHRLEYRTGRLASEIGGQLERLRAGEELSAGHIHYLTRRLAHINYLIAFDRILGEYLDQNKEDSAVVRYQTLLQTVILQLAMIYRDRENMQAAYFAYFLSRHKMDRYMSLDAVQDVLVEYMKKDSFYCRLNALQALYEFGHPEKVVEAVVLLDRSGGFFHEKILTDGLLSYTGSHEELIRLFWERFDRFSERTKLAVLNYIRFQSGDYCERIYHIMTDERKGKELRLSAIRYFGRYAYEQARNVLLDFASDTDPVRWEYAAVSITSLSAYRGEDVLAVLKAAMHSSNWYIRKNAAECLERHGVAYSDMPEVMSGSDRYAREMMMYQLDTHRLQRENQEEKNEGYDPDFF